MHGLYYQFQSIHKAYDNLRLQCVSAKVYLFFPYCLRKDSNYVFSQTHRANLGYFHYKSLSNWSKIYNCLEKVPLKDIDMINEPGLHVDAIHFDLIRE